MRNFKLIGKIIKINKAEKTLLLINCLLSNIASLYCLYLVQKFIDDISENRWNIADFSILLLVALAAYLLNICQMKHWQQFGIKTINSMRTAVMKKALNKRIDFYNEKETGDVVSAILTDAANVGQLLAIADLMLIINVFKLTLIFIVLILKNSVIGLIEILIAVLYLVCVTVANRQIRNVSLHLAEVNAKLNQSVVENVQAFKEIKVLKAEGFFSKKFESVLNEMYYPVAMLNIKCIIRSKAIESFLKILFPIIILALGGYFAGQGIMSVGAIILFYTYTEQMIEPLNNLSDFYREYQAALGSLDRIKIYLTDEEPIESISANKEEVRLTIDINEFKRNKKILFKNIHEEYKSGDVVYLSGESGSGKTTLFSLIGGIEKNDEVAISINDNNINNYSKDTLYDTLKIQFQNAIIPSGTFIENITLGRVYGEDDVEEIIRKVSLDEFADEKGLNYYIKEHANNISGGQKQRLALARILIQHPKILLLDEITNGLDKDVEMSILNMIKEYANNEGAIVIITSHNNRVKEICNKELKIKKAE